MLLCFGLVFFASCGEGEEGILVDPASAAEVPGGVEVAVQQEEEGVWEDEGEGVWEAEDTGEQEWVPLMAAAAASTARNGLCESGEFCFYYNSNYVGSVSDFNSSLGNYGTSQPSCYDFKGTGNGKGSCIRYNAASVWNRTNYTVRIYTGENYTGSYDEFKPDTSGNLSNTYNRNASHQFLNLTTTSTPVPSGFSAWVQQMAAKTSPVCSNGYCQCVALFNEYCQNFLRKSFVSATYAYQLYDKASSLQWTRVSASGTPRAGDVIIWKSYSGGAYGTGVAGHVAIVVDVLSNGQLKLLHQNLSGDKSPRITTDTIPASTLRGYLRPI